MLHGVAKTVLTVVLMMAGCTAGYFGTATYYEKHPQTLAQSHECDSTTASICYAKRDTLLAISPKENWKTWKIKEQEFQTKTKESTDTPKTQDFKDLKTNISSIESSKLTGNQLRETCKKAYEKSNTDSDKTNIETDIEAYCKR
ncbi:hypothetical protein MHSWG343_08570 [Candidatus Mycoplasma haematohominis]|uniref:Lipoprotein n=1 Tax=Candidatus Mycoplasma haematohominis TaxID=1494318 RepID=A0A478FUY0_9MOLU|nr:hypothetical protein MHSWG343_08570 [Candidatus Mycoplasma haemohominis]